MDRLAVQLLLLVLCKNFDRAIEADARRIRTEYEFLWRRVTCIADPAYYLHTECSITQPEGKYLQIIVDLARDVKKMTVNFTISTPRPPKAEYQVLFHIPFDYCKFLENRLRNPFLELIMEGFRQSGNFSSCPLRKGNVYQLKNFTIVTKHLPSIVIPLSDFQAELSFYTPSNRNIWKIHIEGHLGILTKAKS